ncbi:hypothetical protein [Mesorhizobium sp. WSM3876]|uniref:hypothetical protein n=1 Tax=Mesorhizobium sp. WSM3876 TaxID=422277 RepID=UPI000BAE88C5|nr:hypothetical protein [Mesorhizobium sp. WSM3876]PBB83575.1 hypothetical protein CK216_27860 [Mesorhizobium sp. WSM3876]
MSDQTGDGGLREGALAVLAKRLSREANISEEQARELIQRIGTDWDSLLQEAHFLKVRH